MKKIYKLIIAILIPQLAGVIGSVFTVSSVSGWYLTLEKPELNPPSWVFGPVWTALFLMMGYALYVVWTSDAPKKKAALWAFGSQLVLNIFWSVLFFGMKSPVAAAVEIVILWLAIAINIYFFSKVSRVAAWLLAPYIFWVTFAAYLNFSIWKLN